MKEKAIVGSDLPPVSSYRLADLQEGMSVYYTTMITKEEVASFAELSGDVSPLHVNPEFGWQSIYGTNLVHGLLIVSHFSTLIGVFLPGKYALLSGIETRFVKPVPVGSEVTVSARLASIHKVSGFVTVNLLAFFDEEVCVEGRAQVKLLQ